MSRKNTGAWKAIHSMCEMQDINEEALYQKGWNESKDFTVFNGA